MNERRIQRLESQIQQRTAEILMRELRDPKIGLVTITRTGDTTLPLFVPITVGGSAVSGTHFQALPASVTLAAGQASTTASPR